MDKLEHFRTCIQELLEQHSQFKTQEEEVDNLLVFDTTRDHYHRHSAG
ncbi:element excision factor XisI family protein [Nodosilinea sp. AN01ver1]